MEASRFIWSPAGLASAEAHGVSRAEADEARSAPDEMRVHRQVGDDLLIMMGMSFSTGDVIALVCERIAGRQLYQIIGVRRLHRDELAQWKEELGWD